MFICHTKIYKMIPRLYPFYFITLFYSITLIPKTGFLVNSFKINLEIEKID